MTSQIRIVVACTVIVFVVWIVYVVAKKPEPTPQVRNVPQFSLATTTTHAVPKNWSEYRSSAYHFSLAHPMDLVVREYAEGDSATTITFQNIDTSTGFQIFVVPYGEPSVSEARFKKDAPSGVRNEVKSATVDGAQGVTFYGQDEFLGETYETWFIHNGFLYEVTTARSLESWMKPIIETWRFNR